MSYELGEISRQLAAMMRIGRVSELDESSARVKVKSGAITTDWLPWAAARAGTTRSTSMPTVGEQVMVFSPFGDSSQGVVGFSLYQDSSPAASTSKDIEATDYPDGSRVEYNSASNTLTVTVSGSGNVVINCKQATVNAETSITLNTPESKCTGNLLVEGQLEYKQGLTGTGGAQITGDFAATGGSFTHNSKNVGSTHTHSGVQPGGGNTAAPV